MVLIQILLPTKSPDGHGFADELLRHTRAELVDRFGGLTAYLRSPATGAWTSPEGRVEQDNVVMLEILTDSFDKAWWRGYCEVLKQRFGQQSIHLRASEVELLDN